MSNTINDLKLKAMKHLINLCRWYNPIHQNKEGNIKLVVLN